MPNRSNSAMTRSALPGRSPASLECLECLELLGERSVGLTTVVGLRGSLGVFTTVVFLWSTTHTTCESQARRAPSCGRGVSEGLARG
eukprot:6642250-Pyramimonas_sp.AAC.2